jgi:hypothetical protein
MMKGGLLTAWLTEVVLVSYRVVHNGQGNLPLPMPLPSTYVSTMVIYGGLGLMPDSWNPATTLFGWGIVVATLLGLWVPNKANETAATKAASTVSKAASTISSQNPF